ncbi:MAG: transposase [Sandaracinaceae bacterium]|nr:transposase [Sandaracinaceae bacterium]
MDVMAATTSDPSSIETSLKLAEQNLERTIARDDDDDDSDEPPSSKSSGSIREVVADKGYHKASTIRSLEEKRIRTYIPERLQHGKRRWQKHGGRKTAEAVYRNRERVKRPKGKELQRRRGELIERSFAHICETGDHRRTRLRGEDNVRKRYLIQCAGFNLSILMRELLGAGTPRQVVDLAKAPGFFNGLLGREHRRRNALVEAVAQAAEVSVAATVPLGAVAQAAQGAVVARQLAPARAGVDGRRRVEPVVAAVVHEAPHGALAVERAVGEARAHDAHPVGGGADLERSRDGLKGAVQGTVGLDAALAEAGVVHEGPVRARHLRGARRGVHAPVME